MTSWQFSFHTLFRASMTLKGTLLPPWHQQWCHSIYFFISFQKFELFFLLWSRGDLKRSHVDSKKQQISTGREGVKTHACSHLKRAMYYVKLHTVLHNNLWSWALLSFCLYIRLLDQLWQWINKKKKVFDYCPRNSARYGRVVELFSKRQNGYWENFVATALFTTKVDQQAALKMDDKRLSLERFIMQILYQALSRLVYCAWVTFVGSRDR